MKRIYDNMQIRKRQPLCAGPADLQPVFHAHAELCKALANEHRLAILYTLSQGEKCVSDLAAEVGISVHNVSQHLRLLKERGWSARAKRRQTVYYSITNPKFIQGCTLIRQALIEQHREQGQSLLGGGAAGRHPAHAVAHADSSRTPARGRGLITQPFRTKARSPVARCARQLVKQSTKTRPREGEEPA